MSSGANVLILDEPTNHLDLESREALEDALQLLPGLAAARHPRPGAARRGRHAHGRVEDQTLNSYVGGWQEYARLREERKARGESPTSADPTRVAPKAKAKAPKPAGEKPNAKAGVVNGDGGRKQPAGPSKNRQREQARLERAVEAAEAALAALEDELADPRAWATKYESGKSTARHTAAKRAVEDAYAALEAFEASAPA